MKRFIVIAAAMMSLAACVPAMAAQVAVGDDEVTIGFLKEKQDGFRYIVINTSAKDYIEVKTENNVVYRIYPCGRLEKMTWKELNPNEDRDSVPTLYWGGTYGSINTVTTPATTTLSR